MAAGMLPPDPVPRSWLNGCWGKAIMALDREQVVLAYRYILGREPESEAVIEQHRQGHASLASLRDTFLHSRELSEQLGHSATQAVTPLAATLPLDVAPRPVETQADAATLARLLNLVAGRWEAIGETAPHWSVVSSDEFAPERIAETREAFYASAGIDLRIILGILARIGRAAGDFTRIVEYGCGVGRLSMLLAGTFRQVVGLDISRAHLRLAEERRRQLDIENIIFRQVTADHLHPEQDYDLWFSRIVLQHNPPPVILHILDGMFRGLAPGGITIFQVPTHYEWYAFRTADYLAQADGPAVEMHMVPQRAVLELAERHRCRLLEMREDTWVIAPRADCLSNTFVFEKV
ncbi:Methyltransferase domain-containing protein [Belnapia rosea]|nr:Methyltransferase domain-containing protein [Belnapia rosea]